MSGLRAAIDVTRRPASPQAGGGARGMKWSDGLQPGAGGSHRELVGLRAGSDSRPAAARARRLAALVVSLLCGATALAEPSWELAWTRQSLLRTVRTYRQTIGGVVVAGTVRIEVGDESSPLVIHEARASAASWPPLRSLTSGPAPDFAWVLAGGEARPARRVLTEPRPLERHVLYLDAVTGELLRDEPLYFRVRARVFDVNPVAKLNDPSLRDRNDQAAAVPLAAYSVVYLTSLTSTLPLGGPRVQIVDREAPFTARADATQPLDILDRSRQEFEEVNAYFQIDRAQSYLESLGYSGVRRLIPYAIGVDAHAANGSDTSYFVIDSPGFGTLYFGDGGTDDAEDSDIVLHEFAHAIHEWIAPGALSGPPGSQARALSEGFGDYWAFSSTFTATRASGRDPFCIGDWDARCSGSAGCGYPEGADCLRRIDSPRTMADYAAVDAAGVEYRNGEIWSSALREIFLALAGANGDEIGKRRADTIVVEALFGLPPAPAFRDVARRMIAVDRALYGGAGGAAICGAMTSRGILPPGGCGIAPRGEWTRVPSPAVALQIPDDGSEVTSAIEVSDGRTIEDIAVRVDIDHPNRGDLSISLIAPDGTRYLLKRSSETDRTAGVHATFGLDATPAASLSPLRGRSAAGLWTLAIRDVFSGDRGVLRSWGLSIRFAGERPMAERPAGSGRFAVAGHVAGATGRIWSTDVTLLNRGNVETTATVIYTPAGADGTKEFAALRVVLPPGRVVLIENVAVQLQFLGIGSVAVAGDGDVLTETRSYFRDGAGSRGDGFVPSRGAAESYVPRLVSDAGSRSNLGLIETNGFPATGVVEIFDAANGLRVDDWPFAIAPFGHVQWPVTAERANLIARIRVTSGSALVLPYASVIDRGTEDSVIVPGEPLRPARQAFVPLIRSGNWASDLRYVRLASTEPGLLESREQPSGARRTTPLPGGPVLTSDAVSTEVVFGAATLRLPASTTVTGRITTEGSAEFQPLLETPGGDAIGIEVSDRFRSNGGMLNPGTARIEGIMTAYDAAGSFLERWRVVLEPLGIVQVALPVGAARLSFSAGVLGYASMVDNASGDAVFRAAR